MLSYHNNPAIKEKFQLRFAAHRVADEVIQGQGFENGRGCFVGCTLDDYNHDRFPMELGWPIWLAHLSDAIFEGIPESVAPQFGTDLLASVPVGVDLEPVKYIIAIDRHKRQLAHLDGNSEPYAQQCRDALEGVIKYCQDQLGDKFKNNESAARSARSAAESAAWSARSAEFKIERDILVAAIKSLGK